jgi:hypothetical protein
VTALSLRVAKRGAPYFLLLLWVLVFQGPLSGHVNGDDGTYAVMGREILHGHLPYLTMWEHIRVRRAIAGWNWCGWQ